MAAIAYHDNVTLFLSILIINGVSALSFENDLNHCVEHTAISVSEEAP